MTRAHVLVAMSGGVDSSVAALLLRRQGYDVIGFTAELFGDTSAAGPCCGRAGIGAAHAVCDQLSIPHHVANLCDEFEERVIKRFIAEYRAGHTPNPCTDCNRFIKFDLFFEVARKYGCDFVATGHHARITPQDSQHGSRLLRRGVDPDKDQSYFLACITPEKLDRLLFPIGGYTKPQVRKLAADAGLPTATREESQDICFMPSGTGVAELLSWHLDHLPQPGPIVDEQEHVLGQHPGVEHFTIGQRAGLRLGGGSEGLVVHQLLPETNTVVVAKRNAHPVARLELSEFIDLAPGLWKSGERLQVRGRYRQPTWESTVHRNGPNATVMPVGEQFNLAPGQWVVGYLDDIVTCGGIIDNIEYLR
jgi:tRNA-specific 2-thiouridylase